jgi:hypothetical protein
VLLPPFGVAEARRSLVGADALFDPADVAALGWESQAAEAGDVANLVGQLHGGFLPQGPVITAAGTDNRLPGTGPHFAIRYQLL